MKQDLIEGAAAAGGSGGVGAAAAAAGAAGPAALPASRQRELLYEIDRLSLDRVTVKGEGEVAVQALAARPAPGPLLGRPGTPGAGHSTASVGAGRPASAGRARADVRLASAGYSGGSSSGGGAAVTAVITPVGLGGAAAAATGGAGGALRVSAGGLGTPGARSPAGSRGGAPPAGGGHPLVAALSGLSPGQVHKLQAALGTAAAGGR
jgi:hypothetical protein